MCFVYVITDRLEGPVLGEDMVKIGFTSDQRVSNRLKQLQTGNAKELSFLMVLEMKDSEMAKAVERIAHWKLDKFRTTGEWFLYTEEVQYFVFNVFKEIGFLFYGNPEPIFFWEEHEAAI
jgi:hypothetical protein